MQGWKVTVHSEGSKVIAKLEWVSEHEQVHFLYKTSATPCILNMLLGGKNNSQNLVDSTIWQKQQI